MGESRQVKRSKRRRNEGFTLIEVMVALVIFLIGFLGMAGLLVSVMGSNRDASNRTRADELLYEKVEEFQLTSFADIESGSDQDTVGNVVFTREWVVSNNDPIPKVMTIDLTASWTERGDTLSVRQATIKSAN